MKVKTTWGKEYPVTGYRVIGKGGVVREKPPLNDLLAVQSGDMAFIPKNVTNFRELKDVPKLVTRTSN